jgi:hypothetical protein
MTGSLDTEEKTTPQPEPEVTDEGADEPTVPVFQVPPSKSPVPAKELSITGPKTLVTQKPSAKPTQALPSSAPRASPWAKIPAATAVSPIGSSAQPSRTFEPSRRDEFSRDQVKEVSADVYDRSWRERTNNRELFNSHTGKMEPVQDDRPRGAWAGRSPVAKPAVLQRPTPSQAGPAEPSAAFQTGRTSHRPEEYRRRRTSSNVSAGSGSIGGRRQSFTRYATDPLTPDDMGFAQHKPMYTSTFDDQGPPPRQFGGYGPHHPLQNHAPQEISPTMANVSPIVHPTVIATTAAPPNVQVDAPHPPPAEPQVDLLAQQERIMKEARELARKRRMEEEELQEAAKKERLKAKLETLDRQAKEKEEKEAAARKAEEDRIADEKRAAEERRLAAEVAQRRIAIEKEKAERVRVREQERERHEQQDRERQQYQRERDSVRATGPSMAHSGSMAHSSSMANPSSMAHSGSMATSYSLGRPRLQTDRQAFPVRQQPAFIPSSSPPATSFSSTPHPPSHPSSRPSTQLSSHLASHVLPQPFQQEESSTTLTDEHSPTFSDMARLNNSPQSSWKGDRSQRQFTSQPQGNWTPNSSSPWGAIGDRSNQNIKGHYGGNRFNGGYNNGYNNGYNAGYQNGFAHQGHRGQSRNERRPRWSHNTTSPSISPEPSPLGVNLSHEDRAQAVQQWNLTPDNIANQEAMEREKNRAVRLAREAREAATGIKEPLPVQPSLVESFKKMDVQSEGGKTASRALVAKESRGLQQKAPPVPETVPAPAPTPVPAPVSGPMNEGRSTIPKGPASSKPSHFFSEAPEAGYTPRELPKDNRAELSEEGLSKAVDAIVHHRLGKDATSALNGMDEAAIAKLPPHVRHSLKVPRVGLAQEAEKKGREFNAKVRESNRTRQQSLTFAQRATDAEAAGRFDSPPPPISSDHPVHGTSRPPKVRLPGGQNGYGHTSPQHSPSTAADFNRVLNYIGNSIRGTAEAKGTGQGHDAVTPRSKPAFEASPNRAPTVSLPSNAQSASKPGRFMSTVPDSEEFYSELHQQDFGSIPPVKLPRVTTQNYGALSEMAMSHPNKGGHKRDKNLLTLSKPSFYAYNLESGINEDGKLVIRVHPPGGDARDIVCEAKATLTKGYKRNNQKKKRGGRATGFNLRNQGKKPTLDSQV